MWLLGRLRKERVKQQAREKAEAQEKQRKEAELREKKLVEQRRLEEQKQQSRGDKKQCSQTGPTNVGIERWCILCCFSTAFLLLPIACCLLTPAYCVLFNAFCISPIAKNVCMLYIYYPILVQFV